MKTMTGFLPIAVLTFFAWTGATAVGQETDAREAELRAAIEQKIAAEAESLEAWAKDNSQMLESWADKHAAEWESWAKNFEQKIESWAEKNEKELEEWAEDYSSRWEKWAEQFEDGNLEGEDIKRLLKQNLEMIGEIPVADVLEGALREGLEGLEEAPYESLGELNELVGESLEKSLRSIEEATGTLTKQSLKELKQLDTSNLKGAVAKLQESILAKQKGVEKESAQKIQSLKKLLSKNNDLSDDEKAAVIKAMKKEMLNLAGRKEATNERNRQLKLLRNAEKEKAIANEKRIKEAYEQAKLMQRQAAIELEATAKQRQDKELGMAAALTERALAVEKATLEETYRALLKEKQQLEGKDSEIDKMRREIRKLRSEVERLRKEKK